MNMKFSGKLALAGLIVATSAITAMAVPAKPGLMRMQQADGSTVEVQLRGDERHHQYFTADGYLLTLDGGNYCYATVDEQGMPVSSGIVARASGNRSAADLAFLSTVDKEATLEALNAGIEARVREYGPLRGPGLFPESRFPGKGKQKGIVVLVQYTDVHFQVSNPYDYFYRMLNETGFSDYGGTGSAHEYFLLQSMGQFDCDFDVYGPITLAHNQAYYGGNGWGGDDNNPGAMVIEACDQLDATVDFTEYDRDNDGYVDNVFVFYAGRGEASGGGANTVWPHSWTVQASGCGNHYYDGVLVSRYACSNEWESGRPDGVGTFVHEFSHVMGLPDLYATSYTSSFTPGAWSAMDYGPYNNNGCTPPNYSAFERYALEWAEPAVIDGPMNATLPEITTNVCGIIPTSKYTEYFLVENRQNTGWDTYIPGHGMLVWHVDYNESVWNSNKVNNTPSHQYVDIEEADGTQSEYTRGGDAFPGTSNVRSFTSTTNPAMKTWGGVGLNYPLTEISEANGIITFKVCGGAEDIPAPEITVSDESQDGFTISWPATEHDLYVSIYTVPEGESQAERIHSNAIFVDGYNNRNIGRSGSHTVEGLEAMTQYYVVAQTVNGLQASAQNEPAPVFTGEPTLDRMIAVALDGENITEEGFTARWELIEKANNYLLTVNELVFGAPYVDGCDFTGGVNNLPAGWSSTSQAGYSNTAYSGAAVPALRLSKGGDCIQSAAFEDGVRGVSFWLRGNSTSEADAIVVMAHVNGTWTKVGEAPVVTVSGGATYSFDDMPEGTDAIRLDFVRTGTKGAVAIDDIEVRHGETYGEEPVEAYQGVETGNVDSYDVTGLKPESTYVYTVRATDGELVSRQSNSVRVQTKQSSGISAAETDNLRVAATGTQVYVSGAESAQRVSITDIAGRLILSGNTSAAGTFTATVPGAGIYLVQVQGKVVKLAVR